MKDKRFLVLIIVLVTIVVFIGVFIYQTIIINYSLEDLIVKLDGYWVNNDNGCEVVIFADDKFIRGEANTEANEYAYITGSKKTNYNNYDLIINLIDRAGNESKGKVNIDLSNIEDEQILLKVADIDSDYKEYNYISDNENDVWEYCQSN